MTVIGTGYVLVARCRRANYRAEVREVQVFTPRPRIHPRRTKEGLGRHMRRHPTCQCGLHLLTTLTEGRIHGAKDPVTFDAFGLGATDDRHQSGIDIGCWPENGSANVSREIGRAHV